MSQRVDYKKAAPDAMKALVTLSTYITHSGLPVDLINLVYLRVSQINGCAFCIDMHARDLLRAGLKVEKLVLLQAWHEAGALFTPREQIALAWAEAVTLIADTDISDDLYAAATAEFTDKEISDLSMAVCVINSFNRLAISFQQTPQAVANLAGEHLRT